MPDAAITARLIDFELELLAAVADRTLDRDWGRAFLSPSIANVWDAGVVALHSPGLTMPEVAALADEVLGGSGYRHRTVAVPDPAEGARLAAEIERAQGWEVERVEYMVWRGASAGHEVDEVTAPSPGHEVEETSAAEIAPLRRELVAEWLPDAPDRARTVEQLLERDRRLGAAAGDRWFVSPAGEPDSACCLLAGGGIGQVESVGTLERSRGRGLAQAVTLAAVRASQEAGHELTFLAADGDDWPLRMYAKLGFETVGTLHTLRRLPT
jgi:ribosomal protein S18 acetylase RimI-like enzyme